MQEKSTGDQTDQISALDAIEEIIYCDEQKISILTVNNKKFYNFDHISCLLHRSECQIAKLIDPTNIKSIKHMGISGLIPEFRLESMYLSQNAVEKLFSRCRKILIIDMASRLYINVNNLKLYTEVKVLREIAKFCDEYDIEYDLQKYVEPYNIDMYLPDFNIAIEVDENGHVDRGTDYEFSRQKSIEKRLSATFIRINPHKNDYSIGTEIAIIMKLVNLQKSNNVQPTNYSCNTTNLLYNNGEKNSKCKPSTSDNFLKSRANRHFALTQSEISDLLGRKYVKCEAVEEIKKI